MNPFIKLDDITLDRFKEWFPRQFIQQLNSMFMCGNLGDPIISRDTMEIFEHLREVNPRMKLSMHTNGSARETGWWKELAKHRVIVTFGIDGLEDTHHLYRISTDFNKIIDNAKAFIGAGGYAKWHMLVFEHNEHQVEEAKQMSEELGFKMFTTKNTTRFKDDHFQVIDEKGNPLHKLRPSEKSKAMIPMMKEASKDIKPNIICKAKKYNQIYVSACGNVSPCCWLDVEWMPPTQPSRMDYMKKINKFPNLYKESLKDIFDSNFFQDIESTREITPLRECSRQCGAFDKLGAQFED